MTQLDCTVTNCLYNRDCLCSKEDITIGGKNATRAGDTCCESFREKRDKHHEFHRICISHGGD